MKKMSIIVFLLVLTVAVIIGIACSNTEPEAEEPANPDVPPQASMRICMTTFPGAETRALETCPHFNTAAIIVGVWVTVTEAVFVIPRLAFALALTQPPVYEGDSTWSWTLGPADTNNVQLRAHLMASDSVDWSMTITNNELDNFLWYNGRCDFHADGGWWRFYDANLPADSNDVLEVAWEKDDDDTTAHFRVVNINIFGEDYGDTLLYQLDGTIAQIDIHDVMGTQIDDWSISWDINEKFGQIISPDDSSGCWDDSLQCIPCDSLPIAE